MGCPDQNKGISSVHQSNPQYATKLTCTPCVGQNNPTKSIPYKYPRKFCAQSLSMVCKPFEIWRELSLGDRVENPCVGGSIPPRATKNDQNHLRVVFYLIASRMANDVFHIEAL